MSPLDDFEPFHGTNTFAFAATLSFLFFPFLFFICNASKIDDKR